MGMEAQIIKDGLCDGFKKSGLTSRRFNILCMTSETRSFTILSVIKI